MLVDGVRNSAGQQKNSLRVGGSTFAVLWRATDDKTISASLYCSWTSVAAPEVENLKVSALGG